MWAITAPLAALLIGGVVGSMLTADYKQAQLDKQIMKAAVQAKTLQANMQSAADKAAQNYERKLNELNSDFVAANANYGELRVKRCPAVSRDTATIAKADAATRDIADRAGQVEIDLDGVAAEIIRLGGDLDKANQQIIWLQATIDSYLAEVNKKD